jgi:hypothetical protein
MSGTIDGVAHEGQQDVPAGRRYRLLRVADSLLMSWLARGQPRATRVEGRLPEDARVVYAYMDPGRAGVVVFVVESREFEPLAEGRVIPEYTSPKYHAPPA